MAVREITNKHWRSAIIDEQLLKLRTLGLTEEEAEKVIIQNFLN